MANIVILAALGLLVLSCSQQPPAEDIPFDESSIESVWHKAKLRGVAFRAIGQEPGWFLEITDNTEILLVADYGETRRVYAYVIPVTDEDAGIKQYSPIEDETVIEIRDKACMDSMSGEAFTASVKIISPQRTLTGCGRTLL